MKRRLIDCADVLPTMRPTFTVLLLLSPNADAPEGIGYPPRPPVDPIRDTRSVVSPGRAPFRDAKPGCDQRDDHRGEPVSGVAIITEACIGTKDRACVDVCPVQCIYEYDPATNALFSEV